MRVNAAGMHVETQRKASRGIYATTTGDEAWSFSTRVGKRKPPAGPVRT